jgi:di/tricarboxylate transporter
VGILYVAVFGWRLIPMQRRVHDTAQELMDLEGYIAEAMMPQDCSAIDKPLHALSALAEEDDVRVLGLVRQGKRLPGTARHEVLREQDILVLEGGPQAIEQFLGAVGLQYRRSDKPAGLLAEALGLAEVVVPEGAYIEGYSVRDVGLLRRQGVTLLGVSRRGRRFRDRVWQLRIRAGDILLLLGPEDCLPDVTAWLGCLPLAERGLQVTQRHKARLAVGIFAAALASASLGWLYLPVALAGVVLAYVGLRLVPLSQVYGAVEWPIIVLLGSLIPIGAALEASGGTTLMAQAIVGWTAPFSPVVVLVMLMVVTMTLSRHAEQRGHCPDRRPYWHRDRCTAWRTPGPLLDGGGGGGFLCLPDAYWAQEQHHYHGAWGLPVWRLLAYGSGTRAPGAPGRRAHDPGRVAAVSLGR